MKIKCGIKVYDWKCSLPKGHSGDHDYHADKCPIAYCPSCRKPVYHEWDWELHGHAPKLRKSDKERIQLNQQQQNSVDVL